MNVYIYLQGQTVCLYDTTSPVELVDCKKTPRHVRKVDHDTVMLDFDKVNAIVIFASGQSDHRADASPSAPPIPEPPPLPTSPALSMLDKHVDDVLFLSVRVANLLQGLNIHSVRDLVQLDELTLVKCRGFGSNSRRELKDELQKYGLSLGMNLEDVDTPSTDQNETETETETSQDDDESDA